MENLFKTPFPTPNECKELKRKYGTLRKGLEEWYKVLKNKL